MINWNSAKNEVVVFTSMFVEQRKVFLTYGSEPNIHREKQEHFPLVGLSDRLTAS